MARSTRPEFALRDQTVKRRKYAEPGSRIRPDRNPPRQAENIRAIWDGTALRRQSATSDQKFLDCSDDGRIGTIHIEKMRAIAEDRAAQEATDVRPATGPDDDRYLVVRGKG